MAREPASFVARWLFGELREMTPQWFAALFLGAPQFGVLRLSASATNLHRTKTGLAGPVELFTSAGVSVQRAKDLPKTVIAEIPPALCLARKIEAPARSVGQLEAVAALDLARRTPFRTEDVYLALSKPQRVAGGLAATQWVARRDDVARLAHNLKAAGLLLAGVRVQGEETVPALLADLGATGRTAGKGWRRLNAASVVVALAAGLAGWAYPAWLGARALPELTARRDAVEKRALSLRTEIESLHQLAGDQSTFLAELVQGPRLATGLRELTVALPDDTWVSELSYSRDVVVISGETAASAADLVIALAKSRAFANPRLSGMVSRSSTGGERFEIALDQRGAE